MKGSNGKDEVREDQRAEGLKMARAEGSEPAPMADKPVKRERSDKPMTSAEMAEKNKELKTKGYKPLSLEGYCVTPVAQDYLIAGGYADTRPSPVNPKAGFNYRLRFQILKNRALGLGRQLTLAETKEAIVWLQDKLTEEGTKAEQLKTLRDVRPDDTTSGLAMCDIGEEEFQAMSWTSVKDDRPVINQKTGEPYRSGNFFVLPNEDGTFRVGAICRDCVRDYRETLPQGTDSRIFHGHTHAEATSIAEEMGAEIGEVKAQDERRRAKLTKLGSNVNALGEVNRSAKHGFRGGRDFRHRV